MGKATRLAGSLFLLIWLAICSVPAAARNLTFYVTDFGINQYRDGVFRTGDDFRHAKSSVFPSLPRESQVLIVMPPHEKMARMSDQQIKQEITEAVRARVDSGISRNVATFELQIVEHIGKLTYADKKHQEAVNRFGKCAYEAIGELRTHLIDKGNHNPVFHGVFGSNGTKVFSENVDAWKSYMSDATFFDGRAFKTPMIETINTLKAENVRIFNTAGDLPAPNFPWARSIGNHDVAKDLKRTFPSLTVGWIDPLDRVDFVGKGHLAGMSADATPRLLVKFWDEGGYTEPVKLSSSGLLASDSASASRALPGDLIVRHGENMLGPPLLTMISKASGGLIPMEDIPHIGLLLKDGKTFDLQVEKVGGEDHGVIHRSNWDDPSRFQNPGFFSVLESGIPIRFNGKTMTFRDLPDEVKAEVRDSVCAIGEGYVGRDFGKYGARSHCGDATIRVYEEALADQGITVLRYKGFFAFTKDLPGLGNKGLVNGELRDWFVNDWITMGAVMDPSEANDKLPRVGRPEGGVGGLQGPLVQESGVSMQMDVSEKSVEKDETGALDSLKRNVLGSRPKDGGLSWPADKNKE